MTIYRAQKTTSSRRTDTEQSPKAVPAPQEAKDLSKSPPLIWSEVFQFPKVLQVEAILLCLVTKKKN